MVLAMISICTRRQLIIAPPDLCRKSLAKRFPGLSSGLSLNARGIMRSGMAGNSEGSGRECSHTTEEVIGLGQSAMSAGSICQICVVQPSPLLGRSHSIRLSLNNS
jgi:hypothetical protein